MRNQYKVLAEKYSLVNDDKDRLAGITALSKFANTVIKLPFVYERDSQYLYGAAFVLDLGGDYFYKNRTDPVVIEQYKRFLLVEKPTNTKPFPQTRITISNLPPSVFSYEEVQEKFSTYGVYSPQIIVYVHDIGFMQEILDELKLGGDSILDVWDKIQNYVKEKDLDHHVNMLDFAQHYMMQEYKKRKLPDVLSAKKDDYPLDEQNNKDDRKAGINALSKQILPYKKLNAWLKKYKQFFTRNAKILQKDMNISLIYSDYISEFIDIVKDFGWVRSFEDEEERVANTIENWSYDSYHTNNWDEQELINLIKQMKDHDFSYVDQ